MTSRASGARSNSFTFHSTSHAGALRGLSAEAAASSAESSGSPSLTHFSRAFMNRVAVSLRLRRASRQERVPLRHLQLLDGHLQLVAHQHALQGDLEPTGEARHARRDISRSPPSGIVTSPVSGSRSRPKFSTFRTTDRNSALAQNTKMMGS